jgi:predicted nucleic acid-binding Zn ribbon protein
MASTGYDTLMTKRDKTKEFSQIGSVISNVLRSYRQQSDEEMVQIWSLWDRAVGEVVARHSRPEAFKGKLLLVNVSSSTWAHQLQFLKSDIIKKVNEALGKALVEDVKFKIGPV